MLPKRVFPEGKGVFRFAQKVICLKIKSPGALSVFRALGQPWVHLHGIVQGSGSLNVTNFAVTCVILSASGHWVPPLPPSSLDKLGTLCSLFSRGFSSCSIIIKYYNKVLGIANPQKIWILHSAGFTVWCMRWLLECVLTTGRRSLIVGLEDRDKNVPLTFAKAFN